MGFSLQLKFKSIILLLVLFSCCMFATAVASIGGTLQYIRENGSPFEDEEEISSPEGAEEVQPSEESEPLKTSTVYKNINYTINILDGYEVREAIGVQSIESSTPADLFSKQVFIVKKGDDLIKEPLFLIQKESYTDNEELDYFHYKVEQERSISNKNCVKIIEYSTKYERRQNWGHFTVDLDCDEINEYDNNTIYLPTQKVGYLTTKFFDHEHDDNREDIGKMHNSLKFNE